LHQPPKRHRSPVTRRPAALAAGLGVFAFVLVFSAIAAVWTLRTRAQTPAQPTTQTPTQPPKRYWIMIHKALDYVVADPAAKAALTNDTLYVGGIDPSALTPEESGLHIIPIQIFKDEVAYEASARANGIPSYVKAIQYDDETWAATPTAQQTDPVTYYKKARALADFLGVQLIGTPSPRTWSPKIAPYVDVVDVQAQYAQASVSKYLGAIQPYVSGSRTANPSAIVLSGISTNPSAGDPTVQQLVDIYNSTFPNLVSGYWLNIPNPNPDSCPNCGPPRPDIAIAFLKAIGPNGPAVGSSDLNGDGRVDVTDLSILLSHWQQTGTGVIGDINNDGKVDILDLSLLLAKWGT
jgi:hypothetical protein